MTVTVRSFAKINLGLRIGASRMDGFHDLLTVYQTISLHDVLRVSIVRGSGIEIRCADPRVPTDESNTCFRIVEYALRALRIKGRVVIDIDKRLPVQGGMGGASANAVATLVGLERAIKKRLDPALRLQIAAQVGSDLPLFLIGGTVVGVGRGEQVFPLPDFPATPLVTLTPEIGVSTPKAFAAWDQLSAKVAPKRGATVASEKSADATSKLTVSAGSDRMRGLSCKLSAWLSLQYTGAPSKDMNWRRGRAENPLLVLVRAGIENDFEQVVFPEYPELYKGKRALVRAGATYASLSGSGSTLYGLFGSREEAVAAASKLRKQGWAARATSTITRRQYWSRIVG